MGGHRRNGLQKRHGPFFETAREQTLEKAVLKVVKRTHFLLTDELKKLRALRQFIREHGWRTNKGCRLNHGTFIAISAWELRKIRGTVSRPTWRLFLKHPF